MAIVSLVVGVVVVMAVLVIGVHPRGDVTRHAGATWSVVKRLLGRRRPTWVLHSGELQVVCRTDVATAATPCGAEWIVGGIESVRTPAGCVGVLNVPDSWRGSSVVRNGGLVLIEQPPPMVTMTVTPCAQAAPFSAEAVTCRSGVTLVCDAQIMGVVDLSKACDAGRVASMTRVVDAVKAQLLAKMSKIQAMDYVDAVRLPGEDALLGGIVCEEGATRAELIAWSLRPLVVGEQGAMRRMQSATASFQSRRDEAKRTVELFGNECRSKAHAVLQGLAEAHDRAGRCQIGDWRCRSAAQAQLRRSWAECVVSADAMSGGLEKALCGPMRMAVEAFETDAIRMEESLEAARALDVVLEQQSSVSYHV